MTAYAIFIRDTMKDEAEMAVYAQKARAAKGDHQYVPLAYYGDKETLEGRETQGVVILQFADMAAARAWYHSPAYQEAKAIRERAGDYRVLLVDGL